MQQIFEEAKKEIQTICGNPRVVERFGQLIQKKWLKSLEIEKFPAYDDNKHLGMSQLIERFLMRNILPKSDEQWLWQTIIEKTSNAGYPNASMSFWILGDLLFKIRNKTENFYSTPEKPQRPYQKLFQNLLTKKPEFWKIYSPIKQHLSWDDEELSENFRKLLEEMKSKIPDLEVEKKDPPKEKTKTTSEKTTPSSTPAPGKQKAPSSEKTIEKVLVEAKNPLLDHKVFQHFLFSPRLETLCKAIIDKKSEGDIEKILQEIQGIYPWRDRFIKSLALLYWNIEKKKDDNISSLLKSLWSIVFLLSARDKKEVNLDSPQDISLALWEPALYTTLVELTLKSFELFKEKADFEVNVGKATKFNKNLLGKLKDHQLILGF